MSIRKPGVRTVMFSIREQGPELEARIAQIAMVRGLTVRGHPNRSEVVRQLVAEEVARLDTAKLQAGSG